MKARGAEKNSVKLSRETSRGADSAPPPLPPGPFRVERLCNAVLLRTLSEMPSVTFLQYFVLFFDENTSKILQDLGKYCFFL